MLNQVRSGCQVTSGLVILERIISGWVWLV